MRWFKRKSAKNTIILYSMQTYIVIFVSSTRSTILKNHLKSINGWARIADNAWAIVTSKTAAQLRDELARIKAPGDKIFVVRSGAVAAWSNYSDSNTEWFKKYL